MLLEMGGTWFSGIEKLFSGDIRGAMDTRSQMVGQIDELTNAQNYAYQGSAAPGAQGSAEQIMHLRSIDKSLRGGAQ
jgi:hypothetical protein